VTEAHVILRMEHLGTDLARNGIQVEVPHLNDSGRRSPYWRHYSADAREWVEAVHAPDLEQFGYAF
jgi:hypothetical protein